MKRRDLDVIVMNRSGRNTTGLRNRAINAGLFESGRPILLAPPSPPDQIATNVLIAWNRSSVTKRKRGKRRGRQSQPATVR